MINFMNLLRRTEEEIFPSNVKKRKEEGNVRQRSWIVVHFIILNTRLF